MESVPGRADVKREKPPVVYHGSDSGKIEEFEPRKRYTPSEETGALVYASDLPAFAAAHSFPWSSDEGFDSPVDANGHVTLVVPEKLRGRIAQPAFVYRFSSDAFDWNADESTGHTLSAPAAVTPMGVERFETVEAAVRHFGGDVIIVS